MTALAIDQKEKANHTIQLIMYIVYSEDWNKTPKQNSITINRKN